MTGAAFDRACFVRLAARGTEFVGWRSAAVRLYRRALRHDARDAASCFRLGETLGALERWDEAALAFRQAARQWPECAETRGNLAWVLARAGRDEATAVALRELAGLQPGRAELHALLGAWMRRRRRPVEALRAFRDALQAESAPHTTRFLLGEALLGREAWRALADEVVCARELARRQPGTLSAVASGAPTPRALARLGVALRKRLAPWARRRDALEEHGRLALRHGRRRVLLALGRRLARRGRASLALRCFRAAERLRAPRLTPSDLRLLHTPRTPHASARAWSRAAAAGR